TDSILAQVNEQQRKAVGHTDGPLLIIAGAGSGKTRVLTYRIANLLALEKAKPWEVLALTFTNKSAREMKSRIENLVGPEARQLWMGTFHSIFSRILRYECEHIGYNKDFSIYDTVDSDRAIKGILQELNIDIKEIKPRAVRFIISGAKNQLISPGEFQNKFVQSTLDDIAARVYAIYLNRLKQHNAMDFDDLLIKPIELFSQHPDILEKYQDRFKYILIDEYQDTNHAQYKVTRMLADKHKNICVVGDDAQSIYSFRGADISNILNFKEDYPDAVEVPLEQNYRSTKHILKCADSIIKQNKNRLEKTLWTENLDGNTITMLDNYNERDEANRIASYINELKLKKGYSLSDFAILYRTNYQSRVFEDSLRRKGLSYQLVGGISFYQRKEIKDVVAYLKLLVNPQDEESLLRVINEPARGIGDKSLKQITQEARAQNVPMWNILGGIQETSIYKPAKKRIEEFVETIRKARKKVDTKSLVDVTKDILEETGYVKQFVEENSHESLSRRENVMELLNAISYFEKSTENPSLSTFLQDISLVTDLDAHDENTPSVTLMTIHASKGLEFPVVFVVGLEEELFPIGGRNGDEVDMEEERRLFYVAITRAERELFFSFARNRYKFGEEKQNPRSRFLDEVDPAVVRTETGGTIKQRDSFNLNHKHSGAYEDYDWRTPVAGVKKRSPATSTSVHYDTADSSDLQVGARVSHQKFGAGKIISMEGSGDKTKVVVFFQKHGQKKLMLKFAKLQVL
ncbi:MAG: UvrD-helicase domain-containing protein, partial [Balneolales bacterium]